MTDTIWNDADLYAYLDGELEAQRSEALGSELKHNVDLRQRLADLRLMLALMQEAPLRQAPRNYLLTPSMVAEQKPEPASAKRRRPLLLVMRLATTLSALAFVVMVGLQLNMSLGPRFATAPEDMVLLEAEATQEATLEPREEMVVVEKPAEPPTPAATEAAEESPQEVDAKSDPNRGGPAPLWDEGDGDGSPPSGGGGDQPEGLGGGGEPLEEEVVEEAPPDEEVGICGLDETSEECAGDIEDDPEILAEEATGSEIEPVPTVVAEATEEPIPSRSLAARLRSVWPLSLALVFGFGTVLLGIVTWWLARRR